jgi:hypothetical protein
MEEQHFAPLFVHLQKTICIYNLEDGDFEIESVMQANVKSGTSCIDSSYRAKHFLVICGK